jgi:lipopolysaccharide assembly protein A
MRLLSWLIRAFIFFTLFAFALNNLHTATVHWFFGVQWSGPLVLIVLVAFGAGCAMGTLAMLPGWWRRRPAPPPVAAAPAGLSEAAEAGAGRSAAPAPGQGSAPVLRPPDVA